MPIRKLTIEIHIDEWSEHPIDPVGLADHLEEETRELLRRNEIGEPGVLHFLIKKDTYNN